MENQNIPQTQLNANQPVQEVLPHVAMTPQAQKMKERMVKARKRLSIQKMCMGLCAGLALLQLVMGLAFMGHHHGKHGPPHPHQHGPHKEHHEHGKDHHHGKKEDGMVLHKMVDKDTCKESVKSKDHLEGFKKQGKQVEGSCESAGFGKFKESKKECCPKNKQWCSNNKYFTKSVGHHRNLNRDLNNENHDNKKHHEHHGDHHHNGHCKHHRGAQGGDHHQKEDHHEHDKHHEHGHDKHHGPPPPHHSGCPFARIAPIMPQIQFLAFVLQMVCWRKAHKTLNDSARPKKNAKCLHCCNLLLHVPKVLFFIGTSIWQMYQLMHGGKTHGAKSYIFMMAQFVLATWMQHFFISTTYRQKKLMRKMMKKIGKPLTQKIIDECNGKEPETQEEQSQPLQRPIPNQFISNGVLTNSNLLNTPLINPSHSANPRIYQHVRPQMQPQQNMYPVFQQQQPQMFQPAMNTGNLNGPQMPNTNLQNI